MGVVGVDADMCELAWSFKRISLPMGEAIMRYLRVSWKNRFVTAKEI